jgi:hypothetical protein
MDKTIKDAFTFFAVVLSLAATVIIGVNLFI